MPTFDRIPCLPVPWADDQHCKAGVYHRDTYRRTGRTKSGFEMHYNLKQCRRKAGPDGYCYQHRAVE